MGEDTQNTISTQAADTPQVPSETTAIPAEILPVDVAQEPVNPSAPEPEANPPQQVKNINTAAAAENNPEPTVLSPAPSQSTDINRPSSGLDEKFSINIGKWKEHLAQAMEKRRLRWQQKLDKVLALAQSQGTITNQQVKKTLRCTKLTAWRYLKTLEKQGKIRRTGGHNSPTYEFAKT